MKDLLLDISEGLEKKGIVRVYSNYDETTDIYQECTTFFAYQKADTVILKLYNLPSDAKVDTVEYFQDVCEITLKGANE